MFSTAILQLIIFFLPTQLGLHFWPDFSRAAGIRVDYLSPTLYFVDILLITFLALKLKIISKWLRRHLSQSLTFLLFITANTIFSISPLGSVYWWSRFIIYILFFLALRLRKTTWLEIRTPLLISTILIISLEIAQLIGQHSVGGILYWVGERAFSTTTSGLGRLNLFGLDFVRPQSTFSHPNSLAGYLLIVYYLLHLGKSPLWQRLVVFLGILFTFSKATLLALALVVLFSLNSLALIYLFLGISLLQIVVPAFAPSFSFVSDRLFLLSPTKKIVFTSPFFGVGLGGFIPALAKLLPGSFLLPEKLQPVHNLLLLIVSELGFVGSFISGVFIKNNLKRFLKPRFLGLVALVIITGAFDHYWWTLPQNRLVLLFAVSILL